MEAKQFISAVKENRFAFIILRFDRESLERLILVGLPSFFAAESGGERDSDHQVLRSHTDSNLLLFDYVRS